MPRRTTPLHFIAPTAVLLALSGTAWAAGSFDGTYRGTQTVLLNGNYPGCAARNVVLTIQNNHFTRLWGGRGDAINVDVASDGTINATAMYEAGRGRQATVTITGKIAGPRLEADIGGDRCRLHLSLTKS